MRIAMISPFPDKERKLLMKMSAVAQYTYTLLQNILKASGGETAVTVLTEIMTEPEEYTEYVNPDAPVSVQRCYRKSRLCFLSLIRKAYAQKFDLIHIQNETFLFGGVYSMFTFPLFVAAMRLRSRTAVTLHHVIPQDQVNRTFAEIHQTRMPLWLVRLGFSVIYRMIGMAANALIVHEEFFKEILTKDYGVDASKITVICHGVTEKTMEKMPERGKLMEEFGVPEDTETIFGFFGYISKFKGLDVLIHEFKEHLKSNPRSTLVITGALHPRIANDPAYLNYIETLKKSAGNSAGRIIWFGSIPAAQIQHFYKLSDCIVLPYQQTNSTSSVVSEGIGYRTPLLVSEFLKPTLSNPDFIFTLDEGDLSRKMTEFAHKSVEEKESLYRYLDTLRSERLWSLIGKKTYEFYGMLPKDTRGERDVFVVGAYGQTNLGDECLLSSVLTLFGRERCIVLSANPLSTAQEHEIPAVSRMRSLKAFLNCSVIVVGGGDQFKLLKKSTGRRRYDLLVEMAALTMAAMIWRKKVLLLGVGIGNISTPLARFLTKFCLTHARSVLLRDAKSHAVAMRLAGGKNMVLSSDLTFANTKDIHGKAPVMEKTLAIAPAFELEHPQEYARIIREIAKAADTCLAADPALSVSLLPFQPDFHAHPDSAVCAEIRNHMTSKERGTVDTELSEHTVHAAYDRAEILWGVRLHSLIFACMHATPFIALIYDEKIRSFLKEIGCEQWGIELDESFTSEKLVALHGTLLREKDSVASHLREQRNKLMARATAYANLPEVRPKASSMSIYPLHS